MCEELPLTHHEQYKVGGKVYDITTAGQGFEILLRVGCGGKPVQGFEDIHLEQVTSDDVGAYHGKTQLQEEIEGMKHKLNEIPVRYFAYGSNLLSHWIVADKGVSDPPEAVAFLKEHRLIFNKRSKDKSGKGNVGPSAEGGVWGLIFSVPGKEWEGLCAKEPGYKPLSRRVHHSEGTSELLETFIATDLAEGRHPYRWYRDLIIEGAIENKLDDNYIAWLRTFKVMEDDGTGETNLLTAMKALRAARSKRGPLYGQLAKVRVLFPEGEAFTGFVISSKWDEETARWLYKLSLSENDIDADTFDNWAIEDWMAKAL